MANPLLGPIQDLVRARAGALGITAATALATGLFGLAAVLMIVAAGLVALSQEIGFPMASIVFAAVFALLAIAIHLAGRAAAARRAARAAAIQSRTEADIAAAVALGRSLRPLLPIVAFVAAFTLSRRR